MSLVDRSICNDNFSSVKDSPFFLGPVKEPIHAMAHIKSICLDTPVIDGPGSHNFIATAVRLFRSTSKTFEVGTTGTRLTDKICINHSGVLLVGSTFLKFPLALWRFTFLSLTFLLMVFGIIFIYGRWNTIDI